MLQFVYSIYDKKAETYSSPFLQANDASAVRAIQATMRDASTSLAQWPDDYVLYLVGTFDIATGIVLSSVKVVMELRLLAVKPE